MKLAKCLLVFVVLNLTACATVPKNSDAALEQRELKAQGTDSQEAASIAASTISPLTY